MSRKQSFQIKKPSGARKTFAVSRRLDSSQTKIEDERFDSINLSYTAGVLSFEGALAQIKAVITDIKSKENFAKNLVTKTDINAKNIVLAEKLIEHYSYRKILCRSRIKDEIWFSLRHIEPLSLISSSYAELQKRCDKEFNPTQSKRYICRLNQMLKIAGRSFKLNAKANPRTKFAYVDYDELKKILSYVSSPELRSLYCFLYASGCRLGEAFMLSTNDLKENNSIFIEEQLTNELEVRQTKNKKAHKTILLSEAIKDSLLWLSLPLERKRELRKCCQHPLILASRQAELGKDKLISPHSLRHSFVVAWLEKGASLHSCSLLIGDSISTTERYYASFVTSDSQIELLNALQKHKTKLKAVS